jgi:DNA-binding NtrC family response regulator
MRRADVMPLPESHARPLVLVGPSAAARRLADDIRAAAAAPCVLLEGESGLDAIEIARAIHAHSGRTGAFLAVECGAAEPPLVEREIFGETPRRVTGDRESIAPGSALALACGGTLYLGEVAELSAAAQARLARVADDGEVRVAGTLCRFETCVVAAASTDDASDGDVGRMQRDLLQLLRKTRVPVPALRERVEDIPHMIEALVSRFCDEAAMPRKALTQAAITLLSAMPWRGNLVELRHAISRLATASEATPIQLEDVLAHVRFDGALTPPAPAGTLRSARLQFERDYIALVLQHHRGRVGDAARALGIQRTNLYRKARQLGISVRLVQQT